jgi:hypothetical protein
VTAGTAALSHAEPRPGVFTPEHLKGTKCACDLVEADFAIQTSNKKAERAGEMFYTFVTQNELSTLAGTMRQLAPPLADPAHAPFRHGRVFQADTGRTHHAQFVAEF